MQAYPQIIEYFTAEKTESILFIFAGLAAVGISIYIFFSLWEDFYKGMIFPLLVIGIIQLSVGGTIYMRSDSDIERTTRSPAQSPKSLKTHEIPRMETVLKNFEIYRWIELLLITLALSILVLYSGSPYWKGFGLALLAQSTLMLVFDLFAEKRGTTYLEWLQSL